jgi:hypothetical protein
VGEVAGEAAEEAAEEAVVKLRHQSQASAMSTRFSFGSICWLDGRT